MTHCTECGAEVLEGAKWCVECGARLAVSDSAEPTRPASEPGMPQSEVARVADERVPAQPRPGTSSRWQKLRPDVKAGIIFGVLWSIVGIINVVSGGAGFVFTWPVAIAFSLGQGVVVARHASRDSRYTEANYLRLGILSGLWVALIDLVVIILLILVMTGMTLGLLVGFLPILVVTTFAQTLAMIGLPGLSAWLYGRYSGKSLALRLTGVGCGCALLIAVVILILGALGISLLG